MKYYLFNHVGSLNRGCEAIVRGTMNIISNSDPNAEFVLSSYAPQTDAVIGGTECVEFAPRGLTQFENLISAFNVKLLHSEDYALKKMYSPMLKQAEECDVCLSIGGDTYCYGDNRGIQVFTSELKKIGKKIALWGASVSEDDLTQQKLTSLADFDAIFARESLTYNLLREKNANENIFLHADPAFCMERDEVKMIDGFTKENTLGLNVSPLIAKGNPRITDITEKLIEYVTENTTLKILLIPHVTQPDNNDYEYMLPIYEKYRSGGRIAILPDNLNAKQYKGYIAKTRFFIGARTHSTIAAYSCGVPTAVLGYSIKSQGIATDLFGEKNYVLDSSELKDEAELIAVLNSLIEDETEIKETLMRKIPLKLRSAMQMGAKLNTL